MRPLHHHSRGLGMASDGARARLVDELRAEGIADERVLKAILKVPRHEFVQEALRYRGYENNALPIGESQTISQPYVVALMTEALLAGTPPRRVLEIGTGSGYQTAVLAELISSVFSVERIRSLSVSARERLRRLGFHNIIFGYSDGTLGWATYAPYDGIVVTAATGTVSDELLAQLAPGGRMIVPVGPPGMQMLQQIDKSASGALKRRNLAEVTFVPLLAGKV